MYHNSGHSISNYNALNFAGFFTSRPSFRNHLFAPRFELLLYGKTPHKFSFVKRKGLGCGWEGYKQICRKFIFEEWSPEKGKTRLKAIATVEPEVSVHIENGQKSPSLQFKSDSESQEPHTSDDDSIDMDEKERLRRMRISKANKGNVPWNKGRKHSPGRIFHFFSHVVRFCLVFYSYKISCFDDYSL